MARRTNRVTSYSISLGPKLIWNGGEAGGIASCAKIECSLADSSLFTVFFLNRDSVRSLDGVACDTNSDNWPNQVGVLEGGQTLITVFAPSTQYAWYADLVRNEDPVYAVIDDVNPRACRLICGWEPAGEGELPRDV